MMATRGYLVVGFPKSEPVPIVGDILAKWGQHELPLDAEIELMAPTDWSDWHEQWKLLIPERSDPHTPEGGHYFRGQLVEPLWAQLSAIDERFNG
jgi:hypothetical protein